MTTAAAPSSKNEAPNPLDLVIVDCGRFSKKRLKQARKGKGKGAERLQRFVAELRANGLIPEGAQPVALVLREKKASKMSLLKL